MRHPRSCALRCARSWSRTGYEQERQGRHPAHTAVGASGAKSARGDGWSAKPACRRHAGPCAGRAGSRSRSRQASFSASRSTARCGSPACSTCPAVATTPWTASSCAKECARRLGRFRPRKGEHFFGCVQRALDVVAQNAAEEFQQGRSLLGLDAAPCPRGAAGRDVSPRRMHETAYDLGLQEWYEVPRVKPKGMRVVRYLRLVQRRQHLLAQLGGHYARRRRIRGDNRKYLHETMLAGRPIPNSVPQLMSWSRLQRGRR
jgi:hypothetical protein